jgi:hypothetical protein
VYADDIVRVDVKGVAASDFKLNLNQITNSHREILTLGKVHPANAEI